MTVHYNPFEREFYLDPRSVYRRLRDEEPVHWAQACNMWALSRYEDVRGALQNWRVFSNEVGAGSSGPVGELFKEYPHLLMFDPPRHTDLRKVLAALITPDRMLSLKDATHARVRDLLNPLMDVESFDLTQDFAEHLPPMIIADLLGVPSEHVPLLMRAVDKLADHNQPDIMTATKEAICELRDFYVGFFKERRKRAPADDIVWHLLEASDAGLLSENETIGFAILVTIAGGETTTKMIGNMAKLLLEHPDQRRMLVEAPNLIKSAVEESLRYEGSTQMLTRTLTEDYTLHQTTMRAGDTVALIFNAANNDERKFKDPDVYDVTRNLMGQHLAFGGGVHACIGAPLARLELIVAFQELLERWPEFGLDIENAERHFNPYVSGFRRLRLTAH